MSTLLLFQAYYFPIPLIFFFINLKKKLTTFFYFIFFLFVSELPRALSYIYFQYYVIKFQIIQIHQIDIINFSIDSIQSMKVGKLFQKVKVFDVFSTPVNLKINSQSAYKSYFSAFISICLVIAFLVILVSNSLSIARYQKINTTLKETIIKKEWKVNSTLRGVALSVDGLTYQQFFKMFSGAIIYYSQRKQKMRYPLHPCELENWPGLTEKTFIKYRFHQMICPESNTTFYLEGTYRSRKSSYLNLQISPCDPNQKYCDRKLLENYINRRSQLYEGIEIDFYVYDTQVDQNSIQPTKQKINIDLDAIVTTKLGQRVFVQFSTFLINTDTSIFLLENLQSITGNRIKSINRQQINYGSIQNNSSFVLVTFTMDQRFSNYTRVVGKLQDAISKTGGLFYAFIPVIGFIIASYNLYNCDLLLAKSMFTQTQNQAKKNTQSLMTFIKYTIYKFVFQTFAHRINWSVCKQIQFKKKEADSLMQISNIFKRLQNLQICLKHCIDKNEASCLLLTELPSLKQAKLERLKGNYYSKVLLDNPGTTIYDIRQKQDCIEASFDKLRNILKEKMSQKMEKTSQNMENLSSKLGSISSIKSNDDANTKPLKYKSQLNIMLEDRQKINKDHSDMDDLGSLLLCFPEMLQSAEKLSLSPVYLKVEQIFAKCFYNMRSQVRIVLQEKIPIVILIRLMNSIQQLKKQRIENQQQQIESNFEDEIAEKKRLPQEEEFMDELQQNQYKQALEIKANEMK